MESGGASTWPNRSITAGPMCAGCSPTSRPHEPSTDPAAPGSVAPAAGMANRPSDPERVFGRAEPFSSRCFSPSPAATTIRAVEVVWRLRARSTNFGGGLRLFCSAGGLRRRMRRHAFSHCLTASCAKRPGMRAARQAHPADPGMRSSRSYAWSRATTALHQRNGGSGWAAATSRATPRGTSHCR